MSDNVVDSVESTNNSPLALVQGVTRATALMHRAMEERAEQERFRREMNRREKEIREQRARERIERKAREMAEANKWPSQQEAIPGPECSLNETVSSFCFQIFRINYWEDNSFVVKGPLTFHMSQTG